MGHDPCTTQHPALLGSIGPHIRQRCSPELLGGGQVPQADAMLVALPDGMDPVTVASASDNIPDAWRAVGPQLTIDPGADVLVVGGNPPSIGLYAAGIAVALGSTVTYFDNDPSGWTRPSVSARARCRVRFPTRSGPSRSSSTPAARKRGCVVH